MRHYVKNAKYMLKNGEDEKMIVGPMAFVDIPESFFGDPTYRMAVSAGMIEPIISAKQGDKVEKEANEKPGKKNAKSGKKEEESGEGKAADTE